MPMRHSDRPPNDASHGLSTTSATAQSSSNAKVENVRNLSDVHNHSFGEHYGVLVKGLPIPLLARAVIVVGADDTIQYIEYVPEIAQEPDYEPALAALKAAAGA